jgi:hypothetical protein
VSLTLGDLGSVSTGPLRIYVGPANSSATIDITNIVPIDSITIEESGTHESAQADFAIIDRNVLFAALRGEWKVRMAHKGETIFRGFISRPRAEIAAIFGEQAVTCRDIGSLMDRLIIKSKIIRDHVESDKARIQWLVDTVGQPLVAEGMTGWNHVQVLTTEMKTQTFHPRLSLRQAIERVLAASSDSANYYCDYKPALHTFDRDNAETTWVAPKNVVAAAPGAFEIAPEDLKVDWDSDGLVNSFYVQGRNSAGSGFYTDVDLLPGPHSLDIFGLRSAYIQAPDAATMWDARRVAKAALADTRNPIIRGSFTTTIEAAGTRFQAGQLLYVTSTIHGLNGPGADPGPWAGAGTAWCEPQPLRIVSVTTRYLSGEGERVQEIEFGGRRRKTYVASFGG